MQKEIRNNNKEMLIERFMKFPINVRHFSLLKKEEVIDKKKFELEIMDYFLSDVCESILTTNLDTIFPTDKKMLIGKMEVSITNNDTFRISNIIYSKRHSV